MSSFEIETKRRRALFKKELSLRKRTSPHFSRHYEDIVDLIGDPLQWPEHICSVRRTKMCSKHVGHPQRFKLTLFLLSNGVPADIILDFYKANGSLRDESAERSVKALTKAYCNRTLSTDFVSFDLTRARWENLRGEPLTKRSKNNLLKQK
jgi:hypothetical protein